MATTSNLLSASPHLRVPSRTSSALRRLKPFSQHNAKFSGFSVKRSLVLESTRQPSFTCAANTAAGHSDDPERISLHHLTAKARQFWDGVPQPVKDFPWNRALDSFIQLILDLILATIKILSVPLLAISSLSEMSYCARQRKLTLVPFPLLVGVVVAGILSDAALELSPLLKEAQVPWHLITIAVFFTLLKLVGPYFPYWGRIFIPHLANGALVRTIWSLVCHNQQRQKGLPQFESTNSPA